MCVFPSVYSVTSIRSISYSFSVRSYALGSLSVECFAMNVNNKLNPIMCNKKLSEYLFSSFRLFDELLTSILWCKFNAIRCDSKSILTIELQEWWMNIKRRPNQTFYGEIPKTLKIYRLTNQL